MSEFSTKCLEVQSIFLGSSELLIASLFESLKVIWKSTIFTGYRRLIVENGYSDVMSDLECCDII